MTISPTEPLRSDVFVSTGGQVSFPFAFTAFEPEEVRVRVRAGEGLPWASLEYGNEYVTVLNPQPFTGGEVLLNTALAQGWQLYLYPAIDPSQRRTFSNQSALYFNEIERSLDKLTAMLRQVQDLARRAPALPMTSPLRDLVLGAPVLNAVIVGTSDGWASGPDISVIENAYEVSQAAIDAAGAFANDNTDFAGQYLTARGGVPA